MHRLRLRGSRQIALLSCLAVALVLAAIYQSAPQASAQPAVSQVGPAQVAVAKAAGGPQRQVILVVGDSLVAQATAALQAQSSASLDVRVAARLGSAPCDWAGGDFQDALDAAHPAVVVFAFSGNAGGSIGCIGNGTPQAYPLSTLLADYRSDLTELASVANAAGATVVLSTPPARNPQVPAPPAVPTAREITSPDAYYGFQGVPALRSLYVDMVNGSDSEWRLSDAAALAVSPAFDYVPTLSCEGDDGPCPNGVVKVRAGGGDAIHLDPEGHGAKRFARAMIASVQSSGKPTILSGV